MDIVTRGSHLVIRDYGPGGYAAHIAIPSIVGPLLAAAVVYNRLYWRVHLVRTLGIDDLCIGASLIFLFALAVVNLIAVNHGYGQPASTVRPVDVQLALQMFYLDQIFYKFTINLTKLSILTLYLRIFTRPWFVRTCWCCFALVCVYAVASIIATVFQCTPINYFWDHRPPPPATTAGASGSTSTVHPTCINTTVFWLSNALYNIATDVVILVTLPFMIWSLQLPRSQKVGLTFVFGLGIFVFAIAVQRLTTLKGSSRARDPLVGTIISTMWTMIEASTAVICACLPMCRTPLQRVWPRLFPSKYSSVGGMQTHTQTQNSTPNHGGVNSSRRTIGSDSEKQLCSGGGGGNGSSVKLPAGCGPTSGPREVSGGMLAGHHGPGGRTLEDEDEDDFDDLEMQSTSRSRGDMDRKDIIEEVVPVRMKGW